MEIKQFSIWKVKLEESPVGHEQGGDRPFFVLSSTKYNQKSKTPIGFIASNSPSKSNNQFAIKIELDNKKYSHINISQIRTLDQSRFIHCKGQIKSNEYAIKSISKFISKIIFDDDFDDSKFEKLLNECNLKIKVNELEEMFKK